MDEPAFIELYGGHAPKSYAELRALLEPYARERTSAGFGPAAENDFAMGGGGGNIHHSGQ